jgi:hypothetical protein
MQKEEMTPRVVIPVQTQPHLLMHPSLMDNSNAIGILNGAQAMCYHEGGSTSTSPAKQRWVLATSKHKAQAYFSKAACTNCSE